jgi:hypothetical protein
MPAPRVSASSEELAHEALVWLEATAVHDADGVRWGSTPTSKDPDPALYHGSAGVVRALVEGHQHFADDRWGDLAVRGARSLAASVTEDQHPSLYFGLAGIAWLLTEVAARSGDALVGRAAARAMDGVRAQFDGTRFGDMFELMGGNAGIALAALRCGDVGFAEAVVEPYLRTAETTGHGVTWEQRRGLAARRHHLSHGTLGIAYALASVAQAVGRDDLLELARSATADVVARNESGDGFLVPHSDPQQQAPGLERYSYGWCHGPAGDAQLFRLLGQLTGEPRWADLVDRCWRTVVTSGIPRRVRPGFWDNVGRCCGTGGVLALALDRAVADQDPTSFADLLVEDLAALAVVDASGARWSNREHRRDPPELEPRTGWAWGNAGLVPELLRHARIGSGREPAYAIRWPDHPA